MMQGTTQISAPGVFSHTLYAFACYCLVVCCTPAWLAAQVSRTVPVVIPAVASVENQAGEFVLTQDIPVFSEPQFRDAARLLCDLLDLAPWQPLSNTVSTREIRLEHSAESGSSEGYRLEISAAGIRIQAQAAAGAYYAVQTLRQMLPAGIEAGSRFRAYRLPCMIIADYPRFEWRGVLVDCSRHFLPVADVKKIIDGMALLKMNRFHWHLS